MNLKTKKIYVENNMPFFWKLNCSYRKEEMPVLAFSTLPFFKFRMSPGHSHIFFIAWASGALVILLVCEFSNHTWLPELMGCRHKFDFQKNFQDKICYFSEFILCTAPENMWISTCVKGFYVAKHHFLYLGEYWSYRYKTFSILWIIFPWLWM